MHKVFLIAIICLPFIPIPQLKAQDIRFKQVYKKSFGQIYDIAQDHQGYIWIATQNQGLQRFDGGNLKTFLNDARNSNSIASGAIISLCVAADNILWMGMIGAGLEKYDPATNSFAHFRHTSNDISSVSSDTVTSVLEDHLGNLWVGTFNGLDLFDRKTGKFTHYTNNKNDSNSLSNGQVFKVFEDKKGVIWISTAIFTARQKPSGCVLNSFDRVTGKFTRYINNPSNPTSNPGNLINNMYEDRNNNFWVTSLGTSFELYKMDRNRGNFTRYYPDPIRSGQLSSFPPNKIKDYWITFIQEDIKGALWLSLGNSGLIRYDPDTKLSSHFGYLYDGNTLITAKDTISGFTSLIPHKAFSSLDGLFWVASSDGLYALNYYSTHLPFFRIKQQEANALYCEPTGKFLWIATDNGLVRRDLTTQNEKVWVNDPTDNTSLSNNTVWALKPADDGNFWVGTAGGGLNKFDPGSNKFIHYRHDPSIPNSIATNIINNLFIDHQNNLWLATDSGISKMNMGTGLFKNYKYRYNDSNGVIYHNILSISEDNDHNIWAASDIGVCRLDIKSDKFKQFRFDNSIAALYHDSKGILWAGGAAGLYYFDKTKDKFVMFANQQSLVSVDNILGIIEDNQRNLWISGMSAIFKVNEGRTTIRKYSEAQGVKYSEMGWVDNFKATDGRLFLGHYDGYFSFYPDRIQDSIIPPKLFFSSFKLSDKEINSPVDGILNAPLFKATEIRLNYDQNVFSFDFLSLDYITPGDEKYLFKLENYDNIWHDIGSDHRAFFFNIPPGTYNFKVKSVSADGGTAEKTIRILISPPWYKSWWAYLFYAFFIAIAGYMVYKYQRRYIVKRERQRTQQKELEQAKEVEKAYTELKATQAQLIASEKMASLGELTAGIAHEIQNPLNFVNNFSEVNKELLVEMKEEMNKGNITDAMKLADDVIINEEKINHHGKRADSIVKGMLQHSRSGSGIKEATDINSLLDECLRLSFHGMRAKDKSFNAITDITIDNSLPSINLVSQDISRVLLNLFTNSFYSVWQKKKVLGENYHPRIEASTIKEGRFIIISIKDNGNGIPKKIVDKIFQPFFTTKPTGEGTGLGLSLSYDIITKGHGGEIIVNTTEGEFAEFIIKLPLSQEISVSSIG